MYPSIATYATDSSGNVTGLVGPGGKKLPLGYAASGKKTGIVGDSISVANYFGAAAVPFTRAANVVTFTLANHGQYSGSPTQVRNSTDSSMSGTFATLAVADSSHFSVISAGADGAGTANLTFMTATSDRGWFSWANYLLGNPFDLVVQAAVSGYTASQIKDLLSTEVAPFGMLDELFVEAGINDALNNSNSVATITANVKTLLDACRGYAQTINVIVMYPMEATYKSTNSLSSAIFGNLISHVNELRKFVIEYCQQNQGFRAIDVFGQFIDTVNGTAALGTSGCAKTNYTIDGLHPSALGAYYAGLKVYSSLTAYEYKSRQLVASPADNWGFSNTLGLTANTNIWDYAPFTNSGGNLGAGITGTMALGWDTARGGGTTGVASVVARPDGIGYLQQVDWTPAANNEVGVIRTYATYSMHARVSAGQTYKLQAYLALVGVAANAQLKSIAVNVLATIGGSSLVLSTWGQASVTTQPNVDFAGVVRTPAFTIPAGACTSLTFECRVTFAGASASALTVKFGGASLDLQAYDTVAII